MPLLQKVVEGLTEGGVTAVSSGERWVCFQLVYSTFRESTMPARGFG